MLKKLIKFLENNYPDSNINDYLDAKYIQLSGPQLKQISDALNSNELQIKPASNCSADKFIFHFGGTLILVQKDSANSSVAYQAELSWETDFLAVHSTRNKGKGFYFIAFEFDDDYQVTLKATNKTLEDQIRNTAQDQDLIDKAMPVLKGFMSAISK
ncbi:hypothetical protein [uncultured Gammaproteobacteria bacterium]|uniref:hypothetical protein n=1 Tax=Bathymodiolus heckerae thiotrophic gill symbiont TaxID=1052212 RepID=UPI0010B8CABB|nr:hypothetical protein [Bathymodiolus heckerae thiotrophic gill symbiont]CAC9435450.1 hypothetical protein [uncultured Gammaproteobacteria bacterium]CAC9441593.1 hypothetical protein [uncultured Gammaproteobacteria bacterium]SMN13119.1 hypothetical protein BHECKSOX2_100 [Bathymodiolus heckerae thiotrophic gill symbiont]SMN14291.1 hypothetical protein CRYPD_622 [uncultured Candidatus Thioglobus sp.]